MQVSASVVSVVIPARNDALGLPVAVASSLDQSDVQVAQVLLVVGPSNDDTLAVAQRLAAEHRVVEVIDNPAGGIPEALNLGLAAATSDTLVRVDARCRLPKGYTAQALKTQKLTGAVNVGAVQVPVGTTTTQRAIAAAMRHRLGSGGASYRSGGERQKVATAFLGVFDVEALRAVGGWDPTFARNEDAELNHRLIQAGGEVWLDPKLRVDYGPRRTYGALARQFFDYGWWRSRMIVRHRAVQLRQALVPLAVIALLVSLVLAVLLTPWMLIVPVVYLVALCSGAATAAGPLSLRERLGVVPALAIMHLSWGSGFLLSLVRRRNPTDDS